MTPTDDRAGRDRRQQDRGTRTDRHPGSDRPSPHSLEAERAVLGAILMGVGYGGTLWCYVALGDAWRMGVARKESPQLVTRGPYRFVRHPLYLCQLVMGIAIVLLLPSGLSLTVLGVHLVCVLTKARDEEDLNLVWTFQKSPLLGQGWGHGYQEASSAFTRATSGAR